MVHMKHKEKSAQIVEVCTKRFDMKRKDKAFNLNATIKSCWDGSLDF